MNAIEPSEQHKWLTTLVGDWTYEHEAVMQPGEAPQTFRGTERVRSLGGLWTIGDATGDMPGGGTAHSVMTLGYDPERKRFVGTFIASMMTHLWIYENGELDPAGRALALYADGPAMDGKGTAKYKDVIEVRSPDHKLLRSYMLREDGAWQQFMTANYRRVK
jgi:hypothetical protein